MELIFTDALGNPQGLLKGFTLDMAFGNDENDFELTVPTYERLQAGAFVYQYGTERGGVVDAEEYNSTGDVPVLSYKGRTWHGIMAASIVKPDAGADYLTVSGDANDVFRSLIERQGLGEVFAAQGGTSGLRLSNFRLSRYISLYEAMRAIADNFGKRISIVKKSGAAVVGLADVDMHVGGIGSDMPLIITKNHRQVNHLVLLGKGELRDRLVLDVYSDAEGNVSTRQTQFGVDEVAKNYELSNVEDREKLLADGAKKLKDMQEPDEVVIYVPPGEAYFVGDTVRGVAADLGISAQAKIIKQVVSVDRNGTESISCMVGEPTFSDDR